MNEQIKRKDGKLVKVELYSGGEKLCLSKAKTRMGEDVVCYYISNNNGAWNSVDLISHHAKLIERAQEIIKENPLEKWVSE